MGPSDAAAMRNGAKRAAEAMVPELTPKAPAHILYKKLWPQLLVKHAVRLPDVNAICTSLKKRNAIVFLDWPPRGKAPKDEYRMQQPAD